VIHAGKDLWRPRARIADADHVAERQHLRMARQREVGLDGHAAGAIDLGAGGIAKLPILLQLGRALSVLVLVGMTISFAHAYTDPRTFPPSHPL
jgi:hypothetical protein